MPDILSNLAQSFDFTVIFSSVQNFLGSGYIGIAVIAFIAYSVISKLMKLFAFGCVAALVWFICMSGMADPIFVTLGLG